MKVLIVINFFVLIIIAFLFIDSANAEPFISSFPAWFIQSWIILAPLNFFFALNGLVLVYFTHKEKYQELNSGYRLLWYFNIIISGILTVMIYIFIPS